MSGVKIKYKPNHQVVVKAGQDAAEAVGKRFGAYVMTTAKRSIKKRNKNRDPSLPGQPPKDGGVLKKFIRFAYDKSTRSVVIGAELLPGRTDAPEALEKGKSTSRLVRIKGRFVRRVVSYQARPFMLPALEKRLPELPALWKNVIKRS